MRSNLRNLVLLIAVIFAAGLVVYCGKFLIGVSDENSECMKNASTQLHLKENSLATESPATREESGIADVDGFTTHSIVFQNSERPSESLKTEESIAEVVRRVSSIRRSKMSTRRKRNTPKEKTPAWQSLLNVTRFDNQITISVPKADVTGDEIHSGKPRQHLGVALQVGGNDPKDSQPAWDSVESFPKNLFGGNVEELNKKDHGIFIDSNGLPSKIRTDGSKSRSQPRDKKRKFLSGLLGLGGNSENPPINQGSEDALDDTNFTDTTPSFELSNNIPVTESPLMNSSVDEIEHATQISAILKDSTDLQQLETTVTLENFEVQDQVLEEESTIEDSNMFSTPLAEFSEDSLPTPSKMMPKEDAEIESRVSRHGNELRGVAESRTPEISTVMTRNTNLEENFPTAEELGEFCIILLQRMQKSTRRLDDIEGSGSLILNETSSVPATSQEQISTVQQRPVNLGFFANILNYFGRRFRQESSTDGTDFTNSSVELETDNRNARTFNFNLLGSFGSGRSAELNDFENMKFDDMDLTGAHVIERDLPSVSECVTFFRHIGNTNSSGEANFEEDLSLKESLQFEDDAFNVTTDTNERSFGLFLGLGSGERQMQEKFVTTDVDFPTSEILPFGNANVREMHTKDPTYPDFANHEADAKYVITDTEIQTQPPKERGPSPDAFGSEDALISATELDKEDRRFIGFLNSGSGEGREVLESTDKSNKTQPDCVVCTVENGTHQSVRCTECPLGTPSAIPSKIKIETDHSNVSEAASNAVPSNVESFEDSITTPITSEMGSTLIGRLFLSGNDESTDQINLVHEAESTSLPSSSLPPVVRRGRFDDEIPLDKYDYDEFEDKAESYFKGVVSNTIVKTKDIPLEFPEFSTDADVTPLSIDPESTELGLLTPVTTRTLINRRNIKPKLRSCVGASQCDATLNERCIVKGHSLFCDCGRHFVRHSETWRCEEPASVKISLQFPEEVFHEDLRDDSSERYNLMRKASIETIQLFLSHNPELMAALAKVEVTGFEEGSVIVESELVFAKSGRNQSVIEFVRKVHATLKEILEDEELSRQAPLNVGGAHLMSVSAIVHRCDTTEFNNCSPDARCIPEGSDFRCQCNEGYLDNSRAGYAGEECIEICPPNFCGYNGLCDLKSKEKRCLCSGWYFGEKCQINGIVVISGFAVTNVLVVFIVFGAVCIYRRRKRRSRYYGGTNGSRVQQEEAFGHLSAVPSRLQNNLAMKEFGVASSSKYKMAGSTPIPRPPMINVISPSIRSSISYDLDSTFDRSVNVENEAVRL